jgi:virginiamycin A acetyltransferase
MLDFIINKFKKRCFMRKWRKLNLHNQTTAGSIFPFDIVQVGHESYGTINIERYGNLNEKLFVGNFVSIAENVKFILGGNHRTDTLTNFPLFSKYISNSPMHDANTKGPIIIEDEVWIGCQTLILSGVRVGKGAVIAAGSIVTKDIPCYAIAAGNPAKVIKYRFENEIIELIQKIELQKIPKKYIVDNIQEFYKPLKENLKLLDIIKAII